MTTLTIKIPDDAKIKLSAIVKELGGEIVQVNKKLSKTTQQMEGELLGQIESGLRDVAAIKSGKIKRITLSEALNG